MSLRQEWLFTPPLLVAAAKLLRHHTLLLQLRSLLCEQQAPSLSAY